MGASYYRVKAGLYLHMFCNLTSVCFVQIAFDYRNKLRVLVEASVVKRIVAQAVNRPHISATFQQHLHCILTAKLAAQNKRCPEGVIQDSSCVKHTYNSMHKVCN